MPITHKTGSIFDSKAHAIVNPVNTVGVMGAGLAKQFKQRYPEMFDSYVKATNDGVWEEGGIYIATGSTGGAKVTRLRLHRFWVGNGKQVIINLPTKKHWLNPSSYKLIDFYLDQTSIYVKGHQIDSIAFPRLGCGLGGLQWGAVKRMLEQFALEVGNDVRVEVWSLG